MIISSSVLSECAFSQDGITISKSCNCLKNNIVEALQCIKCAIWHDLLFQKSAPSSISEDSEKTGDQDLDNAGAEGDLRDIEESDVKNSSWDELLTKDGNDDEKILYCSE